MTKYEQAIFDLVTCSDEHLTVEQIYLKLKEQYAGVAMATVYNNVNKLLEAGLIHKVAIENMPDRYDRAVKHDHLVCRRCGRLTDISFDDLTAALRRQLGEDFFSYDLKVFYLVPLAARRRRIKLKGRWRRKINRRSKTIRRQNKQPDDSLICFVAKARKGVR